MDKDKLLEGIAQDVLNIPNFEKGEWPYQNQITLHKQDIKRALERAFNAGYFEGEQGTLGKVYLRGVVGL